MSRSGRRRNEYSRQERDNLFIPNPRLSLPSLDTLIRIDPPSDLTSVSDARRWSPEHYKFARTLSGLVAPIGAARAPRRSTAVVRFEDPRDTLVCVRRQQRREVLFALRKRTRKGSRGRKHRRSPYTDVHCK